MEPDEDDADQRGCQYMHERCDARLGVGSVVNELQQQLLE